MNVRRKNTIYRVTEVPENYLLEMPAFSFAVVLYCEL